MIERKTKTIIYSNPAPESWLERSFFGADVQKGGMVVDGLGRKWHTLRKRSTRAITESTQARRIINRLYRFCFGGGTQ